MHGKTYGAIVIGGGITGCGVARDLAGQGVSVALVERHDLASGTSSASTKLIHGGLRYLEQREFRLVREALQERETLLRIAPHLVTPMRFILPDAPALRSRWVVGAGLFLYDHLAGRRSLAPSGRCMLDSAFFQSGWRNGYYYADGWADDSRLVITNAKDAAAHGATIMTQCAVTKLQRAESNWIVTTSKGVMTARTLVNAAGPWARHMLEGSGLAVGMPSIRWVQGSHLIVRLSLPDRSAYMLQQPDRRIVFLIPFDDHHALIGTTERDCPSDDSAIGITPLETTYLLDSVNRYLAAPLGQNHIVHAYSGVRPIIGDADSDARTASRDYQIIAGRGEMAGLISIFGGKLTTYRIMATRAAKHVMDYLSRPYRAWTSHAPLVGGDLPGPLEGWIADLLDRFPRHAPARIRRWATTYGTDAYFLLDCDPTLLIDLGADLTTREIDYLMKHEWAISAEDVLWRRTKQGLIADADTIQRIHHYMQTKG